MGVHSRSGALAVLLLSPLLVGMGAAPPTLGRSRLVLRERVHDGRRLLAVDRFEPARLLAYRTYYRDGVPFGTVPLTWHALGWAYLRSPLDGAPVAVSISVDAGSTGLASGGLSAVGCAETGEALCRPVARARPDADGNYYFEPDPLDGADAFAEVNAFHHVVESQRRLRALGFERWEPVVAVTNFRIDVDGDGGLDPFDNALYFPGYFEAADGILLGQGSFGDLAYDADVVRHEMVHAAVARYVDLSARTDEQGFDGLPVMLAEAYADYFAATFSGDPAIGAYAGAATGGVGPLRRLDTEKRCPQDLSGQAHADSEIFSGALWEIREVLGPQVDLAVAAAVRALPEQPSPGEAADATLEAIEVEMGTQARAQAAEVFERRGIGECKRLLPLGVPGDHVALLPATFQVGRMSPGPFQYVLKVPAGIDALSITVEPMEPVDPREPAPPLARLHLRVGKPVRYRTKGWGREPAYEVVADTWAEGSLTLDAESWPPLMPGSVLYLSPANLDGVPWRYRVRVRVATEKVVVTAAAADRDPGIDQPPAPQVRGAGAMGCATAPEQAGASSLLGLWLWLLAGLGRPAAVGRRMRSAAR